MSGEVFCRAGVRSKNDVTRKVVSPFHGSFRTVAGAGGVADLSTQRGDVLLTSLVNPWFMKEVHPTITGRIATGLSPFRAERKIIFVAEAL